MTDLRKAAEMALDVILSEYTIEGENKYLPDDVIDALRQALAQPEQEPVGWLNANEGVDAYAFTWRKKETHDIPLYTAPPKREWVGLTAEEVWECYKENGNKLFYLAIEAKLKEKNGG